MQTTQPLTKENFWNDIEKKFPEAFKNFAGWIDNFKIEIGWDQIFKCNEATGQVLKFHHLPFEIQNGILARYMVEVGISAGEESAGYYRRAAVEYRGELEKLFGKLEVRARTVEEVKN